MINHILNIIIHYVYILFIKLYIIISNVLLLLVLNIFQNIESKIKTNLESINERAIFKFSKNCKHKEENKNL